MPSRGQEMSDHCKLASTFTLPFNITCQ
jgi:hypothetical protein